MMIDWANLVAGFIVGVLASLAFLLWDRAHERAKLKAEVQSEWISAASELELLLWSSDATSRSIYSATTRLPLDRWRRILGPDDFRILEAVLNAYATTETLSRQALDEDGMRRLAEAANAQMAARAEFSNRVRFAKSDEYTRLMQRERSQKMRKDFRKHPIKTWKRERHNRRTRREYEATKQDTPK